MSQTISSRTPCARMISALATPAAPAPTTTTRDVLRALADDAQGVEQRGEHDDRRAVLVVVEDRDVELGAQPPLDLEAARRGDVLEVDAAERRRGRLDELDDRVDVLRREAQRERVDAGELLEQQRLALHHRHRGVAAPMSPRPSTAMPSETTATVLPLIVSVHAFSGSSRDRQADARDARRVGHREVVAGLDGDLGRDLDLASEVHEERAVGDALDRRRPPARGRRRRRRSPCSASSHATVTSRTERPSSTRTRSIAPRIAPAEPIAPATRANEPGRCVEARRAASGCRRPRACAGRSSVR